MSQQPIFRNWNENFGALWGQQPICVEHRLHESPLFSRKELSLLIENYPRAHYSIIHMGEQGDGNRRYWREGDLGGLSGEEVFEAVANGRLWLNLRRVNQVDSRYSSLLKEMFGELSERIGLASFHENAGILVSSPKAQVYYHADLPAQMLFQLMGTKRVLFYPAQKPFIAPEHLEHIAVADAEVDIPYSKWYDDYARTFEFLPGQMVQWPHTAPHRIENDDCLNVSMTIEYSTSATRRNYIVNLANGILRYQMGWTPRSRALSGPSFLAKAVLGKTLRNSSWVKKKKAKRIEFRLDRQKLGAVVDLAA
ncbi:MAG: hypothetical protein K2Y71_06380 [Xanthobacteraceae bacterium]|nr:hypothetical protein [Xanthobacteraceae bacterium]